MEITLNDDGSFTVKLSPEELEKLKEIQELFKDCSETFDESEKLYENVSLEKTFKEVIEAGFCWLW